MFAVAPLTQVHDPETNTSLARYPVVFEDVKGGFHTSPVAHRHTREGAQAVADALNAALASSPDDQPAVSAAPVGHPTPPPPPPYDEE